MEKVQKPSNSVCYAPSSEQFRIYKIMGSNINPTTMSGNIKFLLCEYLHDLEGPESAEFIDLSFIKQELLR
jgi:hypothetical protein